MNTQELNERQKAALDRQERALDKQERVLDELKQTHKETKALNERIERVLPFWERLPEAPNN